MAIAFKKISFYPLLVVTVLNYVAQVPYYLHNYYIPHHILPGVRALGLLGLTLVWFAVGFIAFTKKLKYGRIMLLSYLVVQALFYGLTVIAGAPIAQLQGHSDIIKLVFLIGYISGCTAGYYAYLLIRYRPQPQNNVDTSV